MTNLVDPDRAQMVEEIRANVAFEQLIGSLVSGAALGGACYFVVGFIVLLVTGGLSAPGVFSLVLSTLTACLSIFLIGFFAGVVVVTPLFKALEKAKRRNVWPYAAAALGVCVASLITLANLPRLPNPGLASIVAVLSAGLFTAFDFGRRMDPIWQSVKRAEEQALSKVYPLH